MKFQFIAATVAAAAAAAMALHGCGDGSGSPEAKNGDSGARSAQGAAEAKQAGTEKTRRSKPAPRKPSAARPPAPAPSSPAAAGESGASAARIRAPEEKPFSPEDRALADEIQAAQDAASAVLARAAARKALSSPHPGVRSRAVCALGSIGKSAMPEIVPFLRDPDPDVASDALQQLEAAIGELDGDDQDVADVIRLAMREVQDADSLALIAGYLDKLDSAIAVDAIIGIVSDGGPGADAAKAAYETVTGEPWNGEEAARDWISGVDPDAGRDDSIVIMDENGIIRKIEL